MMKKRNNVDLPEEMVIEILSRLPTASLARFRLLSKTWNGMIKDLRFAPKQLKVITLVDSRVCLVSTDLRGIQNNEGSAKLTSEFSLKVDIRNVFHCDGLLLCTTMDDRLVVWNPCSGETRWIRPRDFYTESDVYALGYDNKTSCYKILKLYRIYRRIVFAIYDFTSNSWNMVGETSDWYVPTYMNRGVFVKGNVYWIANRQNPCGYYTDGFLQSFDFSTESFRSLFLPHSSAYCVAALSIVREEQICILTYLKENPSDIHVWMTSKIESTGSMSWTKFLTPKTTYRCSYPMSFLVDEHNKAVVCYHDNDRILRVVAQDRCLQVDLHGAKSSGSLLLSYVPTLVQIQ